MCADFTLVDLNEAKLRGQLLTKRRAYARRVSWTRISKEPDAELVRNPSELNQSMVLGPRFGLGNKVALLNSQWIPERSRAHPPAMARKSWQDCRGYGVSLDPRIASSVTHAVASAVAPDERGSVPAST